MEKLIAVFSVLITVINGQAHDAPPYQYSINGFRSDLIVFPEDKPSPTAARYFHDSTGNGGGGSYSGYQSPKRDIPDSLQRPNEVSLPYKKL